MATLPEEVTESPTVQAIYAAYKAKGQAEKPRQYLGASAVGRECARSLWYSFRSCGREEFEGRMIRLFDTGHHEEARFVADLRAIGCEVHDRDESGEQFAVTALAGHFKGHADGVALGIPEAPKTWHLLEFKTHGAKSFAALKKNAVEKAKPEHFAQMQIYMRLMGLDRALYLAVNKDTDELYAERVKHDELASAKLIQKAETIIRATEPPPRINDDPESWACKFCQFKPLCHGHEPSAPAVASDVNCRNCIHATPQFDGDARWTCDRHGRTLNQADQIKACEDHVFIPALLNFAKPIDGGDDRAIGVWIEYERADGHRFRVSKSPNDYTSQELTQLPAPLVGNGTVDDVKSILGATLESIE